MALIRNYSADGVIESEEWNLDGIKIQKEDLFRGDLQMKPIHTYYDNGQIESEKWLDNNNKRNRLDGPASLRWFENGQLRYVDWYTDGQRHRLFGPAYRGWSETGELLYESWWHRGIRYREEKHPFNAFRKEYNLPKEYVEWPEDMRILFQVTYK